VIKILSFGKFVVFYFIMVNLGVCYISHLRNCEKKAVQVNERLELYRWPDRLTIPEPAKDCYFFIGSNTMLFFCPGRGLECFTPLINIDSGISSNALHFFSDNNIKFLQL